MNLVTYLFCILLTAANSAKGRILIKREIESSKESHLAEKNKGTSLDATLNANSSDVDSKLSDRFGFNLNRAHAQGIGPGGGFGASNAAAYGLDVGIVGPGNSYYRPLYHNTGGFSNNYNSGPGGPQTFANANHHRVPGYFGGQSSSGIRGGVGNAFADSLLTQHRIPIGGGAALYSNFNKSDVSKGTVAAEKPGVDEVAGAGESKSTETNISEQKPSDRDNSAVQFPEDV